jgi:hypothetical protein
MNSPIVHRCHIYKCTIPVADDDEVYQVCILEEVTLYVIYFLVWTNTDRDKSAAVRTACESSQLIIRILGVIR